MATETSFSDFKNGVYRLGGASAALGDIWEGNSAWDTPIFDPAVAITPGVGLGAHYTGPVNPAMTSGAYSVVVPGNVGFIAVITALYPASDGFAGTSNQLTWLDNTDYDPESYVAFGPELLTALDPNDDDYLQPDLPAGQGAFGTRQTIVVRFSQIDTQVRTAEGYSGAATSTISRTGNNLIGLAAFDNPSDTGHYVYVESIATYPLDTSLDELLGSPPAETTKRQKGIDVIIPVNIGVLDWTSQMSLSLEIYGIIPRLDAPDDWRTWASDVSNLPGVAIKAPPDPNDFDDWQAWAFRFIEIVQPGG